MLGLLVVFGLVLVAVLLRWEAKVSKYWALRRVPHLPPPSLLEPSRLASSLLLNHPNISELYSRASTAPLLGFFQLRRPVVLIKDPTLLNTILNRDFAFFHDKKHPLYVNEKRDPLSLHLLGLCGEEWKTVRSRLTPVFSSGKVKAALPLMDHCISSFLSRIKESQGAPTDVMEINLKLVTDIIGLYAFGVEPDSELAEKVRVMGEKSVMLDKWGFLKTQFKGACPWLFRKLQLRGFRKDVTQFFCDFVKMSFKERCSAPPRNDFLQLLFGLRHHSDANDKDTLKFTDNLLAAQVFSFVVAGFETTSLVLSSCMFELASERTVAMKATEEVDSVFSQYGCFSYEALNDMTYLQQVIDETLRKHSPVYDLIRFCTKDYNYGDMKVEAGTQVVIPTHCLLRDPAYFPNPEAFIPERFDKEAKNQIKPGTYLPFGDGPRKCIGMRFSLVEMKLILAQVLHNFDLTRAEGCVTKLVPQSYTKLNRYQGRVLVSFKPRCDHQTSPNT